MPTPGPGSAGTGLRPSTGESGAMTGRAWLAALPGELAPQRHIMGRLIEFCETTPTVTSLSVGCSLGRGAADALSDIDAALGIDARSGDAGAGRWRRTVACRRSEGRGDAAGLRRTR